MPAKINLVQNGFFIEFYNTREDFLKRLEFFSRKNSSKYKMILANTISGIINNENILELITREFIYNDSPRYTCVDRNTTGSRSRTSAFSCLYSYQRKYPNFIIITRLKKE